MKHAVARDTQHITRVLDSNKARAKNSEKNSMAKMTGAEISASTPKPSSAKWSGMCHTAHSSATVDPSC
jgi:hypothetical protein